MRGGISKPDIVSDCKFESKCMFDAELASSLLRELKRSQTSFSGHKCIKNVWRPAGLRPDPLGELSAPRDPLAAVGEENYNL